MLQITRSTAIKSLKELIPGCESLNPDEISSQAIQFGATQAVKEYRNWLEVPDVRLWNHLADPMISSIERVTIMTDASYSQGYGPFEMEGSEVAFFVRDHLAMCGECLFNGDVVLIRPRNRTVNLFHHEGVFIHIAIPA